MHRDIVASGTHVALVRMTEADQPMFHRWLATNRELRTLIDDPAIPTIEGQMRWYERARQSDRMFFSIVTLPGEELIGNGGFVDIDRGAAMAQFRITIGNPDALGKGLGTEAGRLIVEYGFCELHLQTISLLVLQENVRAVRSYEKLGFAEDGTELKNGHILIRMTLHSPQHP